jgi:YaiO family outer membrane protein
MSLSRVSLVCFQKREIRDRENSDLVTSNLPFFLAIPAAITQDADSLYKQGSEARRAGRFTEAVEKLREAARLQPNNADVQVELGLALTPIKKFGEAEKALRRALEIAPTYLDAKLGLARITFFRGRFEAARKAASEVASARKDDKDAKALVAQIDKAIAGRKAERAAAERRARERREQARRVAQRAAVKPESKEPSLAPTYRWRFDLDGSLSKLTGGRSDWREANARLGYEIAPGTTMSTAIQAANRFNVSNTYFEGRLDHKTPDGLTGYVYAGATPNALYLPEWAAGAGGTARLYQQKGLFAATVLTLDTRYAEYVVGPVRTLTPGIDQYLFDGKFWIGGRWINVVDENGRYRQGYLVRGDLMLRDDLRVFLGYSDAPETTDGRTVQTQSLFGGIVYDVTQSAAVRFSVEYERRLQLFDRTAFTLGTTYKF